VRIDLEVHALVETELVTGAPKAHPDGVLDLIVREVDELERQIGDEPLELELFLESRVARLYHGHLTFLTSLSWTISPL
jgi:hypothetical protein